MDSKFISFDVESADIVENEEDKYSQFSTAKILAFSTGENLHNLTVSEEDLMKASPSLDNIPILYNYLGPFHFSDFGTHVEPDKNQNLIAGFITPGSQRLVDMNDGSGRKGIEVTGRIWKRYNPQLLNIFSHKNNKPVSVELELISSEPISTKLARMKEFIFHGVTILGSLVTPASPNASMEILSFSADDNDKIKQAYDLEFSQKQKSIQHKSRYSSIDFSIPETVKTNAKNGLELAHSNGRSGAVYMAIGNHLVKSDKVSSDKARYINKNINSKRESQLEFMLMGGEESIQWSKVIVDQMDEKDSKMISYFESSENNKKEVEESMDKTKDEEVKDEKMTTEIPEKDKEQEMAADSEKGKKETVAEEKKESPADEAKETPEEEKAETPAEEKAEKKAGTEKKMSLDAYMDVAATMAFLTKQTDSNKELADKYAAGELEDGELACAMFASMCKMSEDLEKYAAENKELKEFKMSIENKTFTVEVESFMQEMTKELPAEEFAKAKKDASNFSLDNLDDWKNKVKVIAFNFSHGNKETKKIVDFVKIPLPFETTNSTNTGKKSVWDTK